MRRSRWTQKKKAGERVRTVDMQLGKLPLYQLSYTRNERTSRIVSAVSIFVDGSRQGNCFSLTN